MDLQQTALDVAAALRSQLEAAWQGLRALGESVWQVVAAVEWGPYHLVSATIAMLLAVHLLLVAYTVYLRVSSVRRQRRLARKTVLWGEALVAYLAAERTTDQLKAEIPRRDRLDFGTFIQPYLLDFEGEEKERLVQLLHALGLPDILARMLRSSREWNRVFAAHLLGVMGARTAIPGLRTLLVDPSELVRYTAAEALMQLRDAESVPRILTWLSGGEAIRFDRVLALVYEFGAEICSALLRVVQDTTANAWARRVAVDGLAHYQYLEATWAVLEVALRTEDRELRLAALRALVAFDDPTLIGFFEGLLEDPDLAARAIAARAVGSIGNPELVPRLAELLAMDEFWVANEAVRALLALGEPGSEALRAAQAAGRTSLVANLLVAELVAPDLARQPAPESTGGATPREGP